MRFKRTFTLAAIASLMSIGIAAPNAEAANYYRLYPPFKQSDGYVSVAYTVSAPKGQTINLRLLAENGGSFPFGAVNVKGKGQSVKIHGAIRSHRKCESTKKTVWGGVIDGPHRVWGPEKTLPCRIKPGF